MKIIHTSDWHLGMPVGTGSYRDDQLHFLNQLYDLIRTEGAGAVILAGDVYDTSVANAEAIAMFNDAAEMICGELGAQLIVIAGNHDGAARLSAHSGLLKRAGLHIFGRLTNQVLPVKLEGADVYCLPFFHREEAAALYPDRREEIRSTETAFLAVCDGIREKLDKTRRNILVSHALIVDAELSESDRSARIGYATAVSKDVFHGFDYVALGHIHKAQAPAPHIRYCGSPMAYSFGKEESQEKGVLVLDTDTMDSRFVALSPLRGRHTLTGTLEELQAREDLQNDYLRLYVTDYYAGLELQSLLRQQFPYLLELYGKGVDGELGESSLSVGELETLDETDIMIRFLGEIYGAEPDERQLAMFRQALEESEEEEA